MTLSMEEVTALAPDDASVKAARGLLAPANWPLLGASAAATWGECKGSGAKPYQTQVDLAGPAFRCTCPSRKFPCKHGLALLMLQAQDGARFPAGEPPAWVSDWLASRGEKAQKKDAREARRAAEPVDPAAVAKREAQRWRRIEDAAGDLRRFLSDQLARGLGTLDPAAVRDWQTMAARMVDAQAPGLGARLQDAAAGVRRGEHWPERTLHALGLLQLACDGFARRATLPEALQADLRTLAGWPHDQAEVAATGERVADRWIVLAVATEERQARLTERRAWLQGERSGRVALLLDHAFAGRGFEQGWAAAGAVEAELAFFPGSSPLRTLLLERGAAEDDARPARTAGAREALHEVALRVAASPWTPLHPLVLRDAVAAMVDGRLALVADGHAWPVALPESAAWRLLAATGGAPAVIAAEWDGVELRPWTAWLEDAGARAAWIREPAS